MGVFGSMYENGGMRDGNGNGKVNGRGDKENAICVWLSRELLQMGKVME